MYTLHLSVRVLCFVFLGFLLWTPAVGQVASAQTSDRPSITGVGRLNFVVGVPSGAFRDQIQRSGFGGNLFAGARFGRTPLVLGVDLGFLVYDRSVDTVPFSRTVGPRVTVEVVTTNSIFEPHLVLRLQPQIGRVQPYVDGLLGFKYLFTQTQVRDEDRSDDETIASSTNFQDLAWSGGAAAGIDIQVYRGALDEDVRTVGLHLGVQYLVGGRAEYLAGGSLEDTNGNGQLDDSELDIRRSTTTLVQPQVGVTVTF